MLDVDKLTDAVLKAIDGPMTALIKRIEQQEQLIADVAKRTEILQNEVTQAFKQLTTVGDITARSPEKGDAGPPGEAGPAGKDADPHDIAAILEPAIKETIAKEIVKAVADVPTIKGEAGRDGRDAADLTLLRAFVIEQVAAVCRETLFTSPDGGRTLHFTFAGLTHELKTAIPLDAGVWIQRAYVAGDGVTLGGSWFIAQVDTSEKPGASDDWRLAVKRGNDGRDYRPDEKRTPEPVRFK